MPQFISHQLTYPPSGDQISFLSKPGFGAQICLSWRCVIYFLKLKNHYVFPKKDVEMRKVMKRCLNGGRGERVQRTLTF